MTPDSQSTCDAALARAAEILSGSREPGDEPDLPARLAAKAGQPFEALFGGRQKRFDQAIYDAVADLATTARHLRDENDDLRRLLRELRAVVEPIHCRPGTLDASIWADVGVGNEYRLPETFLATDVIIDVGTHVGSFSASCLVRGAGRVVSFEVEAKNFAAARNNLARFGSRSTVVNRAVWRSDGVSGPLFFAASEDPLNTGGGGVLSGQGVPVESVPLDEALDEALRNAGQPRVRMLKLDCEGSEYPILLTSRRLHLVDAVCGEFHEPVTPAGSNQVGTHTRYDRQTVRACLEANGFTVELTEHPKNPNIGLFFATR